MKKLSTKIYLMFAVLMILGVVLMPNIARADWMSGFVCITNPSSCVEKTGLNILSSLAASIGYLVLTVSSWFVSFAGIVLNISIILTMNIKAIYDSTPAIGEVWIVIRNISSMFIIFGLIFTSIQTILDIGKPNVKGLIINIIIAGLLINFSLFFTKTLIDASNLVSLQFYRAICPTCKDVSLGEGKIKEIITGTWSGVGLSNIFMQSLKIQSVYSTPKGFLSSDTETNFLRIFISTIAGSTLMVFAAISFFGASVAFIIRVVLLLLLMAFSPIYFVGMIFPQVKADISKKWESWLIGQLLFMPAYLLLMYVAMKFIGGEGFFADLSFAKEDSAAGPAGIFLSTVGLLLQFTIAFILINVPLIAALKLGGKSTEWGNNAKKWLGGVIGRNTSGRLSRGAGRAFDSVAANAQKSQVGRSASTVLRTLGISQGIRAGLDKGEKSKYGSTKNLENVEKENRDRDRVISGVQRRSTMMSSIGSVIKQKDHKVSPDFVRTIGSMDVKELEKIDLKMLKDARVITAIPTSKFDSLLKSDEFSPDEQGQLRKAREDGYKKVLQETDPSYLIKTLLKGKPGDIAKLPGDILKDPNVSIHLDPAALRKMVDENVGEEVRNTVRTNIIAAANTPGVPPPLAGSALNKSAQYLNTNFVF